MSQFTSILVYCGASQSNAAIRIAARIAASSDAHVTLGDTVEHVPESTLRSLPADLDVAALVRSKKQDTLGRNAARMRRSGVNPSTVLMEGDVAAAILDSIVRDEFDLLVIPAPSTEMPQADRDTIIRLAKESSAPVLLARDLRRRKRLRILAAVDAPVWSSGDAESLNAKLIETAFWLGEHLSGEVHVLHAWDPIGEGPMRWAGVSTEGVSEYHATGRDHVLEELETTIESHGARPVPSHVHVEIGEPRAVIPKFADERSIDLIVIGTFARSGLSGRILGNSADAILDSIPCSMLIVSRSHVSAVTQERRA